MTQGYSGDAPMTVKYTFSQNARLASDNFTTGGGKYNIGRAAIEETDDYLEVAKLFRGTLVTNKTIKATIWTEKAIPVGATVRWDVVYHPAYKDGYVYPYMDEPSFFFAYDSAVACVNKEGGGRIVPVVIETITTSEWKVEEVK